jgi:hypothetical protein
LNAGKASPVSNRRFSKDNKPNPDEPEPNPGLRHRVARRAPGQAGKSFLYPDFTNRPDQKSNGLNPGDSANPDTTIKSLACGTGAFGATPAQPQARGGRPGRLCFFAQI